MSRLGELNENTARKFTPTRASGMLQVGGTEVGSGVDSGVGSGVGSTVVGV